MIQTAKYPIGTKFKTNGKNPKYCEVIDIHYTYNSKIELIDIKYVASHEFCGQIVIEKNIPQITIDMGLIKE